MLLAVASVSALAPTALSGARANSAVGTATRRAVLSTVLSVPLIGSRPPSASADVSTCLENTEVHLRAAKCQASGLGIIEVVEGTGLQPQAGQTVCFPATPCPLAALAMCEPHVCVCQVAVHYTGWLDGFGESRLGDGESEKLFDSSYDRRAPLTFAVGTGKVIKGWDEAVLSMKVGGKRRIIVPPELGYGTNPKGPIPGGSTLYFDVELLKVL